MEYLKCHTSCDEFFTAGKVYPVVTQDEFDFSIVDDTNEDHSLTKKEDDEGYSYKSWFDHIEEES